MMELEEIMNSIYPLDEETIEMLKQYLEPRTVHRRELIIEQGKVSKQIFLIRSGVLRNFVLDDGKEHTRWFATEGDVVASMFSYSQNLPAIASVEALTECETFVINISDVKKLIEQSTQLARWVMEYVIDGLYVLERRYMVIGTGDAMTRYKNLEQMRIFSMFDKIPLQYIASYLNITPQTLSNIRRQIVKG